MPISCLNNILKIKKKTHNARQFIEILRTLDLSLASETKSKLEKHKIPVYQIDHQVSNQSSSGKIILRIPKKYLELANSILKSNE
jgi:hypothetical protein